MILSTSPQHVSPILPVYSVTHLSGCSDGVLTRKCHAWLEAELRVRKVLWFLSENVIPG